jgi:uncharacterized protein YkwD
LPTKFSVSLLSPLLGLALLLLAGADSAAASDLEARLIERVNQHRQAHGLAPLARHPALGEAARAHAVDMARADSLSHMGSDGSRLEDRLRRAGYGFRVAAENLASGPASPEAAADLWMASEGHRRNMLIPEITEAGAAMARRDAAGPPCWVLALGRR